jgi:DNA-binding PadR family transcriptional regulator
MAMRPGLTDHKLRILVALAEDPKVERCGADLRRETGLPSGTLYVALRQLERAGWVESRWETPQSRLPGRPQRRFYKVTDAGVDQALAGVLGRHPAFR